MPRKPTCLCGSCLVCRNRKAQRLFRERTPRGGVNHALRMALAHWCRGVTDATSALSELTGLSPTRVGMIRQGRRQATELEIDALLIAIDLHPSLLYLYGNVAA